MKVPNTKTWALARVWQKHVQGIGKCYVHIYYTKHKRSDFGSPLLNLHPISEGGVHM